MIGAALSILSFILGLFGFGKRDERDTERNAGEKLGQQETENANAQAGIRELETAIAARDANSRDVASDPTRLRNGSDPAAGDYKPGPN